MSIHRFRISGDRSVDFYPVAFLKLRVEPGDLAENLYLLPLQVDLANLLGQPRLLDGLQYRSAIARLVSINGMNSSSTLFGSCSEAFMPISTRVTMATMISTNTGMRSPVTMTPRNGAMYDPVETSTTIVASPMPRPLVAVQVKKARSTE